MILYYLSEAFKSFKRAKLASIITILTTTFALALLFISISLVLLSGIINEKMRESVKANIYLNEISTDQINKLKSELEREKVVKDVRFLSKEEAKREFIEQTGKDFTSILEVNPLPASFIVTFKSDNADLAAVKNLLTRYESRSEVNDIIYDYDFVSSLFNLIESFKTVIYTLSFILMIISIYLIFSTNKLVISSRKKYYDIMKLVGARLNSIKVPILIFGTLIGFIASLLSIFLLNLLLFWLNKYIYDFNFTRVVLLINPIIIAAGCIFGFISSYVSSRMITLKIERF